MPNRSVVLMPLRVVLFSILLLSSARALSAGIFSETDWGGDSKIRLSYEGEVFYGLRLQPSGKTRYRGLVNLYLSVGTQRVGLWPNGVLYINGQNGHGESFTVNPEGVELFLSDIDASDFTQISEFGLKQDFFDSRLECRIGKQDVNKLFAVNSHGRELIFPAYTLIPTVPMPTFPAPALGASLWFKPTKPMYARLGFYEGSPRIGGFGFDRFVENEGGYFAVFEPGWTPNFGLRGDYRGKYGVGFWGQSGVFQQTGSTERPRTYSRNYGVYLMAEQWVYREREGDDQGMGVFLQLGWAPSDRNRATRYVGAGFLYKGLFPGREDDRFSIAASRTALIGAAPDGRRGGLTHVECFYVARLASWLGLQPDVQYFSNPGGGRENGFAFGLRWLVHFQ